MNTLSHSAKPKLETIIQQMATTNLIKYQWSLHRASGQFKFSCNESWDYDGCITWLLVPWQQWWHADINEPSHTFRLHWNWLSKCLLNPTEHRSVPHRTLQTSPKTIVKISTNSCISKELAHMYPWEAPELTKFFLSRFREKLERFLLHYSSNDVSFLQEALRSKKTLIGSGFLLSQ